MASWHYGYYASNVFKKCTVARLGVSCGLTRNLLHGMAKIATGMPQNISFTASLKRRLGPVPVK